jgi:nudix-type nucleoside diphosphatase (YffH/AdpP family)
MKPEILERQIAHAGYVTVEHLRMQLTDGAEVSREVERHGDAAAVLPYDVERRSALVVRLFRAPVLVASGEEMSEEACAGMIENEDADTTARREAYEELGVDLPSLEFVARVWSSPGVSTERQSLFLAPYRSADRISDGGGVEGEREGITVEEGHDPIVQEVGRGDRHLAIIEFGKCHFRIGVDEGLLVDVRSVGRCEDRKRAGLGSTPRSRPPRSSCPGRSNARSQDRRT